MRLQGSEASNPKTLQSRTRPCAEKRILINGLAVVHGRLVSTPEISGTKIPEGPKDLIGGPKVRVRDCLHHSP